MTTVFLVIADLIPVLMFSTRREAEQFCVLRPDLKCVEFKVPSATAEREEVEANLRDLFALKQGLKGETTDIGNPGELDAIIRQRHELHRAFLQNLHSALGATTPLSQCPKLRCPGRMAEGLLTLE